MNTCRFCHGWEDQKTIIRFGTRHYAHLRCAAEKGKAEEYLRKLPTWSLGQLPALVLADLKLLNLVRDLMAEREFAKAFTPNKHGEYA